MGTINGNKFYVLIDDSSGHLLGHMNYGFTHDDEDPEPVPTVPSGVLSEHVDSATLGGLTQQEFFDQKKASVSGGAFVGWLDRASAPSLVLSGSNPKADGSNTPSLDLSGAPSTSDFKVLFSSEVVDCELTDCEGTTDGSGEASWKIRTMGRPASGSFVVTVSPRDHSDWQSVSLIVQVDPGSFV